MSQPCSGAGACLLIEPNNIHTCEIDPNHFHHKSVCDSDHGIWCESSNTDLFTVVQEFTVAVDLSSFDVAAVERALRQRYPTAFEVHLKVSAASVRVHATLVLTSEAEAMRVHSSLSQQTAASLSTLLGVTVTAIQPPAEPVCRTCKGTSFEVTVGVALGAGVLGLLAIAGWAVVYKLRRERSRKSAQPTSTTQPSTQPTPPATRSSQHSVAVVQGSPIALEAVPVAGGALVMATALDRPANLAKVKVTTSVVRKADLEVGTQSFQVHMESASATAGYHEAVDETETASDPSLTERSELRTEELEQGEMQRPFDLQRIRYSTE